MAAFQQTRFAVDNAAWNGHLDIVKWLHLNRSEGCTSYAMYWAVINGHISIVKYLYESGLVTDQQELRSAIESARRNGLYEIVEYLKSKLEL